MGCPCCCEFSLWILNIGEDRHKTCPYKSEQMKYDHYIYHRSSTRLKGYDYSQAGAYSVTICTQDRECLFGDVFDGAMRLNDAGQMVHKIWNDLSVKYPDIETDEFVVMPNHVHGIIMLSGRGDIGHPRGTLPGSVGRIVQVFKSLTTHEYIRGIRGNGWPPFNGRLWQRNYYEHIIRSEEEMNRVREYIMGNPLKWAEDKDNPANIIRGGGFINGKGLMNQTPADI
jgi:REP element-mobilizing transposase RayT